MPRTTPRLVICDAGAGCVYARNLAEARIELQWWERHADHSVGRSQAVALAVVESMRQRIKELTPRN